MSHQFPNPATLNRRTAVIPISGNLMTIWDTPTSQAGAVGHDPRRAHWHGLYDELEAVRQASNALPARLKRPTYLNPSGQLNFRKISLLRVTQGRPHAKMIRASARTKRMPGGAKGRVRHHRPNGLRHTVIPCLKCSLLRVFLFQGVMR